MIEPQPFKVDQCWSEVKEKQAANPIMKEDFHTWRNDPVTKRLYEDLEGRSIEYAKDLNADARLREGIARMIRYVFEWAPVECYGEDQ